MLLQRHVAKGLRRVDALANIELCTVHGGVRARAGEAPYVIFTANRYRFRSLHLIERLRIVKEAALAGWRPALAAGALDSKWLDKSVALLLRTYKVLRHSLLLPVPITESLDAETTVVFTFLARNSAWVGSSSVRNAATVIHAAFC